MIKTADSFVTAMAENLPVSDAGRRWMAAGGAAIIALGATGVALFDPSSDHFFPVCPLYSFTGFACPGCGLTRAFHALFHGDWIGALDFNLLTPVWALIFAWVFVSFALTAIRGQGLRMWPLSPKFVSVFLTVLIVFGVLRNIPVWPLTILFP